MRIKIGEAVCQQREIVVRPALYADKCDHCGTVFKMEESSGNVPCARMSGIFDRSNPEGGGGNGFDATACSFACAHELFAKGGWKKLRGYGALASEGARLHRVTLTISDEVMSSDAVRTAWERCYPLETTDSAGGETA